MLTGMANTYFWSVPSLVQNVTYRGTGLYVRGPILWEQGSMHVVLP